MITYGHIKTREAGKKNCTCVALVNVFEVVKVKSNYFMCNQWRLARHLLFEIQSGFFRGVPGFLGVIRVFWGVPGF